jgi:hypothetical protein
LNTLLGGYEPRLPCVREARPAYAVSGWRLSDAAVPLRRRNEPSVKSSTCVDELRAVGAGRRAPAVEGSPKGNLMSGEHRNRVARRARKSISIAVRSRRDAGRHRMGVDSRVQRGDRICSQRFAGVTVLGNVNGL